MNTTADNAASVEKTKEDDGTNDCIKVTGNVAALEKSSVKIMELMRKDASITIPEIAAELSMTKRGVEKAIKKMQEAGVIARIGPDKGGHWKVTTQKENIK